MNKKKIIFAIALAPLVVVIISISVAALLGTLVGCKISVVSKVEPCILGGFNLEPLQEIVFLGYVLSFIAIPWALAIFAISGAAVLASRYIGKNTSTAVDSPQVDLPTAPMIAQITNQPQKVRTPAHLLLLGMSLFVLGVLSFLLAGSIFPASFARGYGGLVIFLGSFFCAGFGITLIIGGLIKYLKN